MARWCLFAFFAVATLFSISAAAQPEVCGNGTNDDDRWALAVDGWDLSFVILNPLLSEDLYGVYTIEDGTLACGAYLYENVERLLTTSELASMRALLDDSLVRTQQCVGADKYGTRCVSGQTSDDFVYQFRWTEAPGVAVTAIVDAYYLETHECMRSMMNALHTWGSEYCFYME